MANLAWLAQYKSLAQDAKGRPVLAPLEPPIAVEQINFGAGVANSAVFNSETKYIAFTADVACYFLCGKTPVASATTAFRLAAGAERIMGIDGFHGHKLSVIKEA